MTNLYIHGQPGTGKTTRLVNAFVEAAKLYGPDRVAAVTYTRAAADELKQRAAHALHLPADPTSLRTRLPYVGTIHALCNRQLGKPPLLKHKHRVEVCAEMGLAPPHAEHLPSPDEAEGFYFGDFRFETLGDIFFKLHSEAIHRKLPITQLAAQKDPATATYAGVLLGAEGIYRHWKKAQYLHDFEDLLVEGKHVPPPVKFLLVDEAQDNSPLMWEVLDAWAAHAGDAVYVGDPFQAIYTFVGAEPHLFFDRWERTHGLDLGASHRLSPESAEYARVVLEDGGWDTHGFVSGSASASATEETTFYLARTHEGLREIRRSLIADGEPFVELRGESLWQSSKGKAYRTLSELQSGGTVPVGQLQQVVKALPTDTRGVKTEALLKYSGVRELDASDAEFYFGNLQEVELDLDTKGYFHRIESRYGTRGLHQTPSISVGTIHAAKGKEADVVYLVRSWGTLPWRAMATKEGTLQEACVAYVATTRHRQELRFLTSSIGYEYPFPVRR